MAQDRESVLYFDGNGDYITVADSEALRVNNYTVEVWIKTDGVPTGWQGIVGKPGRNYCVWLNSPRYLHHCFHTTETYRSCFDTDNILEWNKWQHIAITNDGTTAKTYLNGELKKETPTEKPLVVDKTPLRMGVNLEGSAKEYFKGQMTEVRLWNKVRSEAEIKDKMFTRLKGDEKGLAGYWPLNDVTNNTASDETKKENHGKIYGAVVDEQLPLLGKQGDGHNALQYVLKFDGDGDYVKVENPPCPTDSITVSCWAKNAANATATSRFLRNNSYILEQNPRDKTFTFYIYSGTWYSITAKLTDVDMTKWHNYTATLDGNMMRCYVDGVEVKNTNFTRKIDKNTSPMYIGSNSTSDYFVNGKITEVQVWNKALGSDKIKANMTQRLTGKEDGLVGY
ncbi:MAG: LamG domain-containing protein [Crocosphaera sp.]